MGEVYAAYDPELDRKIAIKLVRADRSGNSVESRVRLMREAQATAKVSHPNVVVVYDAGTSGDRVFIAMEFVEGHTLRYWLQQRDRSWAEILEAYIAAGRGLAAAHERDLVHRDFKPDNVMVDGSGHVRVMDFGLARVADAGGARGPVSEVVVAARAAAVAADPDATGIVQPAGAVSAAPDATAILAAGGASSAGLDATAVPSLRASASPVLDAKLTQTGALLGTPAYMSPEQFEGRPADARSDQFSFCVALWEALFGDRPFGGRSFFELAQNVTAGKWTPAPANTPVPGWIRKVLERGISTRPEDRFATMTELLEELDRRSAVGHGDFARGAADKLAGVWEPPVGDRPVDTRERIAMRQAFLATGQPYAEDAFAGASAVLDRYAKRWAELYVDVCEATHVRGEQSAEVLDLRMACLLEGLDDLKALCRLFRTATAEVVQNAITAATALGTLERCQDVELLRAVVRPPDDPAVRAAVGELRLRLADVRAQFRVGRYREGVEAVTSDVARARQIGYGPTLAEALLLQGSFEGELVRFEASAATMEEAVWVAELARHDEVAVEAASYIIVMTGFYQTKFELSETWCRHTEMLLRRMGGHDLVWGWYLNNRALMRSNQGRLADAIADAGLAIEAKERALGPDAADVGITLGNLADYLVRQGDMERGLEVSERAVRIQSAGFGPEHPRTAIGFTNHAEFLVRAGRFADARGYAERAIVIFERDNDPNGLPISYPLLSLGLSQLALGRVQEAIVALERVVRIRDALESDGSRLGEAHFALGRALHESGDRARGMALVRQARPEYQRVASVPLIEQDLGRLDAWLAAHGALA
jgi:serine/threonine protein kinase/tetratricopeptide (TPR) repeat protein